MISMKTNLLSQKQQLTPQPKHANENRERDSMDSLSPAGTTNVKATQSELNVSKALPTARWSKYNEGHFLELL